MLHRQHKILNFDDTNTDLIAYSRFSSYGSNQADIERMKQILLQALSEDLTSRQRECITLYFYDNMKMKEIAAVLSLSPSTVTRHIKAAKRKLQNVAKYY